MLYKALANKLGLLDPLIVQGITAFHSKVQTVRDWLPQLVDNEDRGFSYSALSVLDPALQAITDIKPILDTMADKMQIERPKEEADLGAAHDVADMEREAFAERS